MLHLLPDFILSEIFSFYHPYKAYYTSHVMKELHQNVFHKRVLKQLHQFSTYDVNRNLIRFEK